MNCEERNTKVVLTVCIGIFFLCIPLLVMFFWNEQLDLSAKIDNGKFGTFGDFFGGVFGSMWSLAGVILFYLALKEQRSDFQTNSNALVKQVEALEIQTNEFRLQREELTQTRNVFVEQSKILKQQRFENTFFSLLELFSSIVAELNSRSIEGDFFGKLKSDLNEKACPLPSENVSAIREHYINLYRQIINEGKLSPAHYFKLFYRILKLIDDSDVDEYDKFLYMKILRSQLSEQALLITYYNSYCPESKSLYKLILKYNLLKHLPKHDKLEFKSIISQCKNLSGLDTFNNCLEDRTTEFISELNRQLRMDDFDEYSISFTYENITIRIQSDDDIYIEFNVTINKHLEDESVLGFEYSNFNTYLHALIYDIFISSQYTNKDEIIIDSSTLDGTEIITVKSKRPLKITTDTI
ncbi:putative phage abortive infection protein [Vibrio vulnificus]|uniref:putative phage abortive infection protein n=1 Tax=Vibrio vulnificus TaxID=672 RepID=UPI00102A60CF|nr:putative phage abortive infection protein [Vibrio vulnificus]EGQ7992255.1 hypothetical protein [Vibrio vulnificus]MCU8122234.1 putative phage abortive infection protein [Vibrio vulnificus]MCU8546632.1 putative phage abortive infection protein [Vibrio vulnificus]MCU8575908.1 putative phage abortive infection protein [Vibrio vulnificus]RZP76311.1 hypothetical protein D8T60_15100 [Vibrio vulnificus]